jgi:hypothetical protein
MIENQKFDTQFAKNCGMKELLFQLRKLDQILKEDNI